ncbi:MAG: hypothetical protein RMX35_27945 [Nostoc sp. DcaGUA01]|nr:hypothetical protein [Nostoc sp. DcaGUA01]
MRAAIIAANTNGDTSDTINLAAGNYTLSLVGANEDAAATGDLDITNGSITIVGAGVGSTSITANQIDRVFQVLTGATLTLSELTISGGKATNGGGIYNSGTLAVSNATIADNLAAGVPLNNGGRGAAGGPNGGSGISGG